VKKIKRFIKSLLVFDMKKLILIFFLVTTNLLAEIKTVDAFFANIGGRYSYEANFDADGNISNLIRVIDFKQLKSTDGCFDIEVFSKTGKIYKFLKDKNLKIFCNQ